MSSVGLLGLPGELLLQMMELLRDSRDFQTLQAVACTCKTLREVAEIYLYSVAEFTTLSSLHQFLDATLADPRRKAYLRDLRLLYSTRRYSSLDLFVPPDLVSFPNLASFVSESPECQPVSAKGTRFELCMDYFTQVFSQASLLNESLETTRPLQNLRSLTLHWTGANERYWDITPACPIFLLPQLHSLEISCAKVGQEEPSEWAAAQLQRFRRKTCLRSLILTECIVSVEALHLILSFPRALQRLDLCEKYYHPREIGGKFAVNNTEAFNRAIAQQSESLRHLNIFCHKRFTNLEEALALSLSDFPVLSHLQLGPFPQVGADRNHVSNFILDYPIPPALSSLRLSEYGVHNLMDRSTDKILSALSIKDLIQNAEARGVPFALDISLSKLPYFLARHRLDVRSSVRGLVERLGRKLRTLQRPPTHSGRESNSEPASDNSNQASSRLRVLTNKPRHKIPPFLHDEGPPRFVVRYDSWHPQEVLDNPYTADPIPLDRDLSSDDEDMDAAFSHDTT
ncbi:hypothetical protein Hte_008533 [Hypoxylon texense]